MSESTKISPFTLIAFPSEGDQLANFVERYAKATCDRVLPSLALTFEEREELNRQDFEFRQKMQEEPWKYNFTAEECYEYGNSEGSFEIDIDSTTYAEMEASALRMHILGLVFSGLFYIFERQIMMVLYRLEYRRRNTVLKLVSNKERHTFAGYKKLLQIGGYPICGIIGADIERLRLISNVMKHGSTRALRTLNKQFPEIFWHGSQTVSIDNMLLTTELLLASAKSIATFWRDFPIA